MFFALPMIAWIHFRQWHKAAMIPWMIVSTLGTVLLFFNHHFGAVPLFSIVMCRCLKWRGIKCMPSETTTEPAIQIGCAPRIQWPVQFRAIKINYIKSMGVIIVAIAMAIVFTSGQECLSFTENLASNITNYNCLTDTSVFNVTNCTNSTKTISIPGCAEWYALL